MGADRGRDADYAEAVEAVRAAIGRGDVYQVNLVQHLSAELDGEPSALAARLASFSPRLLAGDGWAVVSASPELFLARRGRRVWTAPIKGRGRSASTSKGRRTRPST